MAVSRRKSASANKSASAGSGDIDGNWYCQIGPNVSGPCSGYVLGQSAFFYVSPSGDLSQTYAYASPDGGSTWYPIPNNQGWTINGVNVTWSLNPMGGQIKMLIGPPS